jgi:hypothetical protein
VTDLATVSADDFEGWASTPFQLHLSTGDRLPLTVIEVDRGKARAPAADGGPALRTPFSVIFSADLARPVVQNVHRIEHPEAGVMEILLVPLNPVDDEARYEAIFA